ncbi:MAG: 50S ribosomal protein L22 [Burkholderiales bacterium]
MVTATNERRLWSAMHRFARISPRKVKLLIDLIRGRKCGEAMDQLRFSPRRSARMIENVLKSAMVNADEQEADMRSLFVKEARVDGGPYYRRWRPKDRGRAHPIAKRTSHIVVTVAES